MNTRQKIMGLAALPLAGLLATGGVALAQGTGSPAGAQVVHQAVMQRTGNPAPVHPVRTTPAVPTPAACQQSQVRDRDQLRDGSCDHQAKTVQTKTVQVKTAQTADQTRTRARDGSCDHQAKAVQTADRTRDRARDGSCDHQAKTANTVSQVRDRAHDGSCDR